MALVAADLQGEMPRRRRFLDTERANRSLFDGSLPTPRPGPRRTGEPPLLTRPPYKVPRPLHREEPGALRVPTPVGRLRQIRRGSPLPPWAWWERLGLYALSAPLAAGGRA